MKIDFLCFLSLVPVQVQAKDNRAVLAAALPKVTKTIKPQAPKMAGKGAKQSVGKKNNQNLNKEEESGDKNDKTKPQVTHELSMVRFLSMKLVTVRSAVAVNRLTLSVAGLVFN